MKKLFTLLIVIFILLIGCAGLNLNKSNTRVVEFGPNTYTLPSAIPDFTSWQGDVSSMFTSKRLNIVRWYGTNPKNADEAIILLIAGENQKQAYFIAMAHTPSIKLNKQYFYADKQYLLTGRPSFVMSAVPEAPDVEEFIVMKQLQLTPKVEI